MRAVEFLHADNDFLLAAETGNEKVLEILIRKRTNVNVTDHLGRNALHLAVCSTSINVIEMLLRAGVDVNVRDALSMTPLYLCLFRRPSLRVCKLLFDYGAIITSRVSPMDTGLFIQFVMMCKPTSEEEKILRLLIEKGSQINDLDAPGGRQALHFAAMSNNCDLIRLLLEMGADPYLTNHSGQTPREVAIAFQCKEAFALFEQFMGPSTNQNPSYSPSSIRPAY